MTEMIDAIRPQSHASALCGNDLHIWIGDISPWEMSIDRARFSPEELARSQQLRSEKDRRRLLARRLCARHLAATYLDCDPATISVTHEPSGKPFLSSSIQHHLHLSMSSSGDQTAFAFSNRLVGIDIERTDSELDANLLTRVLTPAEITDVNSTHPDRFFAYWTRKEAYLKAIGTGLRIDPATLDLLPLPAPWQGVWASTGQWSIASWKLNTNHMVSLCIAGAPAKTWFGNLDTARLALN